MKGSAIIKFQQRCGTLRCGTPRCATLS